MLTPRPITKSVHNFYKVGDHIHCFFIGEMFLLPTMEQAQAQDHLDRLGYVIMKIEIQCQSLSATVSGYTKSLEQAKLFLDL